MESVLADNINAFASKFRSGQFRANRQRGSHAQKIVPLWVNLWESSSCHWRSFWLQLSLELGSEPASQKEYHKTEDKDNLPPPTARRCRIYRRGAVHRDIAAGWWLVYEWYSLYHTPVHKNIYKQKKPDHPTPYIVLFRNIGTICAGLPDHPKRDTI